MDFLYKIFGVKKYELKDNFLPLLPRELWKIILRRDELTHIIPYELAKLKITCKMFNNIINELLMEYNKSFYEKVENFRFIRPRFIRTNGFDSSSQTSVKFKDSKLFYSYGIYVLSTHNPWKVVKGFTLVVVSNNNTHIFIHSDTVGFLHICGGRPTKKIQREELYKILDTIIPK